MSFCHFCWYQITISISSSLLHYLFYSFSRYILFVWHCDSRSTNDFSSIEFFSHLRVIWSHISYVTILVNPLDLSAVSFAFRFLLNGTTKMSKILLLEFFDYIFKLYLRPHVTGAALQVFLIPMVPNFKNKIFLLRRESLLLTN